MSSILSRRDLDFLLYEWLDVESLTTRPRFAEHSRETFDAALDLAEQIATEHFAPHNRKGRRERADRSSADRVEMIPEVAEALQAFADAGLIAGSIRRGVGGMQLPHVVGRAALAWFQAANVGTSAYPFLTMANANLLLAHGTPEQIDTTSGRCSRAAGSAPCACPSRRPARRCRHHHPRRAAGRRHLPADRQQDVDLRRRPRADREHRPPGAGQDPRRARPA